MSGSNGATPSGVGDWQFIDPQFSQVREFMRLGDGIAEYIKAGEKRQPANYEEELLRMRWERVSWLFEHIVRGANGEKLPALDSPEAFEKLGWNQLRNLEAAANGFLFDQPQGPTS